MDMIEWAENEVRIACNRENPNYKEGEWDYGCACYESALKAFRALCEDGHSGYSWSITRSILGRLMRNQPLTPIEDTEDAWNDIADRRNGKTTYQCRRMSSLFKDVYDDGRIDYHDIDYCYAVTEGSDLTWYNGFVSRLIHEMWPITLPWVPSDTPIKVVIEEDLFDENHGDYDAMIVKYCIKDGERINIDRYFVEGNHTYIEISKEEYLQRRENSNGQV